MKYNKYSSTLSLQKIICICSIIGTVSLLIAHIIFARFGWDFRTYQTAVIIWLNGGDPYSLQALAELGHTYPFVYPPITLPFLAIFTIPTMPSILIYLFEFALLIILCSYMLVILDSSQGVPLNYIWAFALLLGGFAGGYWAILSGNSDLIFLTIICFSLYAADNEYWFFSGILLGIAGFIKIIPIMAGGAYLLMNNKIQYKIHSVLGILSSSVLIFGGSYVFFPRLFPTKFLNSVSKEGGVTEIIGQGTVTNFPILYLWQDLAQLVGLPASIGLLIHAIFSVFILVVGILWIRNYNTPSIKISLALLLSLLVFTRLKPYYLIYAVPAVFFITRNNTIIGEKEFWIDIILILALPMFTKIIYSGIGRQGVRNLSPVLTIILQYMPILCLFIWSMYKYKSENICRSLIP